MISHIKPKSVIELIKINILAFNQTFAKFFEKKQYGDKCLETFFSIFSRKATFISEIFFISSVFYMRKMKCFFKRRKRIFFLLY